MSAERDVSRLLPSPQGPPRLAWHHASAAEVAGYWQSELERGLDPTEAKQRLARVGYNRLPEEPPESVWRKLYAQLSDFTVLALIVAAAIAAGLGLFAQQQPEASLLERFGDSIAILLIVTLNAALGLAQARKAERALDALREMTAPAARVVRGGRTLEVPAPEVVPGDVILLADGDRVPADARLIDAHDLEVEEASLTGESMPVSKDAQVELPAETSLAERRTMVFMGTRIARGRARAMVANTGLYTELGAIAGMLQRVQPEKTPLEEDLQRFGKRVVASCIAVSAVVFAAGLLFGHSTTRELFLVAVALAVAAIPEGLPAVTTIVLALGTARMAKRRALVRRLPAVETLGCTQVICTDKTGTLTQNVMTARTLHVAGVSYAISGDPCRLEGGIVPPEDALDHDPADVGLALEVAAHANAAHVSVGHDGQVEIQGDPTDGALLMMSRRMGVECSPRVLGEQPFGSARRMASVLASVEGQVRSYVRGAPEAILERSVELRYGGRAVPMTHADRQAIAEQAANWASRTMRVIALAVRDNLPMPIGPCAPSLEWESELTFVGLVGILDPPRPEVPEAIAEARRAGIRTVMITGDHPVTARAVAEEIMLWQAGDLLITGAEIDALDQQRLEEVIDRVRVVARATAEHKLRIVTALKARGFICAMTGDGVNDAPAVKAASIGVAMGRTGTDVTKEAAALVLADDNYATIVAAVEEGRAIYANIRKFIFFLLSSNAGAVLFVLAASLLGWEAPLAPIQILWINLITNGLPALALGVDTREPEQMTVPPREPGGAILSSREYVIMLSVGTVMAATAAVAFYHFLGDPRHAASRHELWHARTIVFSILSIGPLLYSFNCRSALRTVVQLGPFSNRALWGAVATGLMLQAITIYVPVLRPLFKTTPLEPRDVLWIFALAALPFILGELVKVARAWKMTRNNNGDKR